MLSDWPNMAGLRYRLWQVTRQLIAFQFITYVFL